MISYTTVGTKNLKKSGEFFDKLFSVMGAKRIRQGDTYILWGTEKGKPAFSIFLPFNGNEATIGNGSMIALEAESPEHVEEIYNMALSCGAPCEGEPGPRDDGIFYMAYFRDLDGHKYAAFYEY